MTTSEVRPRERRPTLTTACATIASTAGAMPANRAVTAVVVPNAMYTAESTNMQTAPGSTNNAPASSPPRNPFSSQPM